MDVFWFSFQMVVNIFEGAVFCYFIAKHFPSKFSKSTSYLINGVVVLVMSGVYAVYFFLPPPWWLETAIVIPFWVLFAFLFRKGIWYEKGFWSVLILGANYICAVAAITLAMHISGASQYTIVFTQGVPRFLLVVFAKTSQIAVIYYFSKFYITSLKLSKTIYLVLTSVSILSIAIALSIMETAMVMGEDLTLLRYLLIAIIGLVAIVMMAYYLYYKIATQSESLFNAQSELQHNAMMEQHNDELIKVDANMKNWRHDFHNHLQTLLVLSRSKNTNDVEDYIMKLGHELRAIDDICNTGQKALDAIITVKYSIAKSYGITLSLNINPIALLPFSDVDVTTLLGNLIDNAIEACRQVIPKETSINLSLGMMGEMIYVRISNTTNGIDCIEDGKFLTTKPDHNLHGFGLLSIDRVVNSVGGIVQREHKNNVFTTTLLLPTN
ncbi:MAG: GHKL domain-containing protein [Defluviitaleaceae bacterium]|nr:GHKL domain-containing protein [Defluviitaleaceae bacterium]